jgi:phage-related protein
LLANLGEHEASRIRGDSIDCLREFPADARQEAGFQLDRVQRGLEPFDWKPMPVVGLLPKENSRNGETRSRSGGEAIS